MTKARLIEPRELADGETLTPGDIPGVEGTPIPAPTPKTAEPEATAPPATPQDDDPPGVVTVVVVGLAKGKKA